MGVWIEIGRSGNNPIALSVTPCVGVWIEIEGEAEGNRRGYQVTPCVGVWIEITSSVEFPTVRYVSLPAWECGLK